MPLQIGTKTETNVQPSGTQLSGVEVNRIKAFVDDLQTSKVNAQSGKDLSSNDYTDEEKEKLGGLPSLFLDDDDSQYASATSVQTLMTQMQVQATAIQSLSNRLDQILLPAAIQDGSTFGWIKSRDLSTITKNSSNKMTQWASLLNLPFTLAAANTDALMPTWAADGVIFDGLANLMSVALTLTGNPLTIYAKIKVFSDVPSSAYLYNLHSSSGDDSAFANIGQPSNLTIGDVGNYDGSKIINSTFLPDAFIVLCAIYNGATSSVSINGGTAVTGNTAPIGTSQTFVLGQKSDSPFGGNNGHIQVKEMICRMGVDSDQNKGAFINYLNAIA